MAWRGPSFSLLLSVLTASCGHMAPPPLAPGAEVIVWEEQNPPFCGRCVHLKLTVRSDGVLLIERGHWAGDYRDWRVTRRYERITPEQFAAFSNHLAQVRPRGGRTVDERTCETYHTDQGGFTVSWAGATQDQLSFDSGCASEETLASILEAAPSVLGIETQVE